MLRSTLALALVGLLSALSCSAVRIPTSSIQRLGDVHAEGFIHEFCTTWATKVVEGGREVTRWVTAAHCLVRDDKTKLVVADTKYVIHQKPATLVRWDEGADLALFDGIGAPTLTVAFGDAAVGQRIYTLSFFLQEGAYTEGVMAGWMKDGTRWFNLAGGHGSSGAPVLSDGLVVGVVLFMPCSTFPCPVTGGAGVEIIRTFLLNRIP